MRLSDLLTYTVVDRDGSELGMVSDVRILQDGPLVRGVQAAFRVDALVVGRGGLAERLGYIRTRVEGPWLLRSIFARLERSVKIVPVSAIDRWDDDAKVVHVRGFAFLKE
ncbi:MAG: hypothetical protein JWM34_1591 [Ilumatobacteraceae bacterium]|nr:hypothetical protein [Ilumatobacteraceae bacterium]